MPFVTDIAGPQRPGPTWPPLAVGVRAPHQHHRHPSGRHRALRRRPAGARRRGPRPAWADVLGQVGVRAHLADRVIDDIAPTRTTTGWRSCRQPGRTGIPRDGRQAASRRGRAGEPAAPAARRLGRRGAGLRLRACSTRRSPWASRRSCRPAPPTTWPVSARASRRTPRSSRTPDATAPFRRYTDRLRRRSTSTACTPSNRCARMGCGGSAGWTSDRRRS